MFAFLFRGSKGQVRWPEGPPHLAQTLLIVIYFFCGLFFVFVFISKGVSSSLSPHLFSLPLFTVSLLLFFLSSLFFLLCFSLFFLALFLCFSFLIRTSSTSYMSKVSVFVSCLDLSFKSLVLIFFLILSCVY